MMALAARLNLGLFPFLGVMFDVSVLHLSCQNCETIEWMSPKAYSDEGLENLRLELHIQYR